MSTETYIHLRIYSVPTDGERRKFRHGYVETGGSGSEKETGARFGTWAPSPPSEGDVTRGDVNLTATTAIPAPDNTVLLRQAECAQQHAFTALYSHLLGSTDALEA